MAIGHRRRAVQGERGDEGTTMVPVDTADGGDEEAVHRASWRASRRRRCGAHVVFVIVAVVVGVDLIRNLLRHVSSDSPAAVNAPSKQPSLGGGDKKDQLQTHAPTPKPTVTAAPRAVVFPPSSMEYYGLLSRRGLFQERCLPLLTTASLLNTALGGASFTEGRGDGHLSVALTAVREAALRLRLRRAAIQSPLQSSYPSSRGPGLCDLGFMPKGRPMDYEDSSMSVVVLGEPAVDEEGHHDAATTLRWILSLIAVAPSRLEWLGALHADELPSDKYSDLFSYEVETDMDDLVVRNSPIPYPRAVMALLRHCSGYPGYSELWHYSSNADKLKTAQPFLVDFRVKPDLPTPVALEDIDVVTASQRSDVVVIPCVGGPHDAALRLHIAAQQHAEMIFVGCISHNAAVQHGPPLVNDALEWAREVPQASPAEPADPSVVGAPGSTKRTVTLFLKRFPEYYTQWTCGWIQAAVESGTADATLQGGDSSCVILSRRPGSVPDVGRLRNLWHSTDPPLPGAPGSSSFAQTVALAALQRFAKHDELAPEDAPHVIAADQDKEPASATPKPAAAVLGSADSTFEARRSHFEARAGFTPQKLCAAALARAFSAADRGARSEVACRGARSTPWGAVPTNGPLAKYFVDIHSGGSTLPGMSLYDLIDSLDMLPGFTASMNVLATVHNTRAKSVAGMSSYTADVVPLLLEAAVSSRSVLVVGCDPVLVAIALHAHKSRGVAIGFYGLDTCDLALRSALTPILAHRITTDDAGVPHGDYKAGEPTPLYQLALADIAAVLHAEFSDAAPINDVEREDALIDGTHRRKIRFATRRLLVVGLLDKAPNSSSTMTDNDNSVVTINDASYTGLSLVDYDAVGANAQGLLRYPVMAVGGGVIQLLRSARAPPIRTLEELANLEQQAKDKMQQERQRGGGGGGDYQHHGDGGDFRPVKRQPWE